MPWWQNFSSSSLNRPHYDDTQLGAKQNSKSGMFTRRNSRHQITSGKKPRNLTTEHGVEQLIRSAPPSLIDYPLSRSSPAHGNPPSPQPLPLPELQLLLRPPNSNAINVPLPSPRDRTRAGDASSLDNSNGRVSSQEGRWSADPSEIRYGRGSHVLQSAPASPYSVSPIQLIQHYNAQVDHQNSNYVTPGAFQVWSAPATISPSTERVSLEKTSYSFDNSSSPLNSPRISPNKHAKTHIIPTSPLTNLSTWREGVSSNSQGNNVHPLPLPPMGSSLQAAPTPTPTPTPVPHLSLIPDVVPVNSQWQKGKLIGRGTFGSVYVASNKETGALCAMKEVELLADDPKSAECIKQLEQEIKVLSNLQHPNIVQYYGSEIVGDRFYIYLEYVHPGSLTKFIKDHCGAMTEAVVRNFTRHILSGLAYLHSTKTIHRDIKGANLLVDAYGVVKLADFGMAKHLNGHRENLSLKGSPYWMAPELLQSVIQTDPTVDVALAVDIWSLGCTIIEMLSGRPPWSEYEGAAALFKVLKENPPIPENLSEEANDFLQCCFQRNPAERPTASMLLEHRFLKCSNQHDVSSNFGTRPMSFTGESSSERTTKYQSR